jgi:hypothetical protein
VSGPAVVARGTQRLSIGVMGASGGELSDEVRGRAYRLGKAIAEHGAVLITGACPGLPYEAVLGARAAGGLVVGISPGLSIDEHRGKYHSPVEGFDVLIYTGSGLMGREITNIRSCDIVVIAGGRTGTLGELAIAYDEGRLIAMELVPTNVRRTVLTRVILAWAAQPRGGHGGVLR